MRTIKVAREALFGIVVESFLLITLIGFLLLYGKGNENLFVENALRHLIRNVLKMDWNL